MTREGAIWLSCEGFKPGDREDFTWIVQAFDALHVDNARLLAAHCQTSLDAVRQWGAGQAHPEPVVQETVVRWIEARVAHPR